MSAQIVAVLQRVKNSLQYAHDMTPSIDAHALGVRAGLQAAIDGVADEIECQESAAPLLVRTEQLEEALMRAEAARNDKQQGGD